MCLVAQSVHSALNFNYLIMCKWMCEMRKRCGVQDFWSPRSPPSFQSDIYRRIIARIGAHSSHTAWIYCPGNVYEWPKSHKNNNNSPQIQFARSGFYFKLGVSIAPLCDRIPHQFIRSVNFVRLVCRSPCFWRKQCNCIAEPYLFIYIFGATHWIFSECTQQGPRKTVCILRKYGLTFS